ncbi:MAG: LysM peptidoglycan-binding domain-containing protein [bacterium]|nr:LysM peptidoglycan-binding domain-containing protein [Myxococcales bacterium]
MSSWTYTGRGLSFLDALYAEAYAAALGVKGSLTTAADALLGLNTASVAKMVILHETSTPGVMSANFDVLFNPSRVSMSGGCGWQPRQHAAPGHWSTELSVSSSAYQPTTLSIDLLVDTTDEGHSMWAMLADAATGGMAQAFAQPTGQSVLAHTQKIAALAQPAQELHRPPICQLWWGPYMLMQGVLTSVTQEFKLWKPDGTPVRATLSCSFTEFEDDPELHSPDVEKTHVIRRGETLPAIAAAYYGDATRWWVIARFNGLQSARAINPGTVLRIPALER